MMQAYMPYLAILLSVAALVLNVFTAIRAGKWRDSEEHKDLVAKVNSHSQAIPTMLANIANLVLTATEHGNRLAAGEERFKSIATKADLAEVSSDVRGLEKTVAGIDAGVTRIEQFLINGGGK